MVIYDCIENTTACGMYIRENYKPIDPNTHNYTKYYMKGIRVTSGQHSGNIRATFGGIEMEI